MTRLQKELLFMIVVAVIALHTVAYMAGVDSQRVDWPCDWIKEK